MANVILVNEKDEVIGVKPRNDLTEGDIIRVSALIVLNSNGEMLIARRALSKLHNPGKWSLAVAGTVEEGETYMSNIIKEAKEEISLVITESDIAEEVHDFTGATHKYFYIKYSTLSDKPISEFTIQKEEVEEIRWISLADVMGWYERSPQDFTTDFKGTLEIFKLKIQQKSKTNEK